MSMAPQTSVAASPAGIMMLVPPADSLGAVVKEYRRIDVQYAFAE